MLRIWRSMFWCLLEILAYPYINEVSSEAYDKSFTFILYNNRSDNERYMYEKNGRFYTVSTCVYCQSSVHYKYNIFSYNRERCALNYGYIRISTKFQNVERQERNIRLMCPDPNLVIIKEIFTGSTQDRPKWRRYYPRFMPGDNIYFDSVSRMARDEDDGVKEYLDLYKKKVNLFSSWSLGSTRMYIGKPVRCKFHGLARRLI